MVKWLVCRGLMDIFFHDLFGVGGMQIDGIRTGEGRVFLAVNVK